MFSDWGKRSKKKVATRKGSDSKGGKIQKADRGGKKAYEKLSGKKGHRKKGRKGATEKRKKFLIKTLMRPRENTIEETAKEEKTTWKNFIV